MSMNPSSWSAKAQALAVALVPVVVAALNAWLGWHLDPQLLLGLFGLGAVGAASVAHIDNGEPAVVGPLGLPASTLPVDDGTKAFSLNPQEVAVVTAMRAKP